MSKFTPPKYNLIGHRGVAGLRPENTLCSFAYAAELGLSWIEFDVQLSKDDHWIVMHDDCVDRTSNGRGLVNKMTIYEIEELDAGTWFKPPFPNQKIPTLLEALKLAQELNIFCDVEIKGANLDAKKFASLFAAFLSANKNVAKNILVTSFDLECLVILRCLAPDLNIGFNIESFTPETIPTCLKHNFANINANVEKVTKQDVQFAIQASLPVFLFTVNDKTTARYWLDNGVQGLFTDRPDLLL